MQPGPCNDDGQTAALDDKPCPQTPENPPAPKKSMPKLAQKISTPKRKYLPPLTPQRKRKQESEDLQPENAPKTPRMRQENQKPKKNYQPRPEKSRRTWNEFTKIDGKLVLMRTIDLGLIRSTRKPRPHPAPTAQSKQEMKILKLKKIYQIDPLPPPNPVTPRRKYLELKAKAQKPKSTTEITEIYKKKICCTPASKISKKKCIPEVRKKEDKFGNINLEPAAKSPVSTSKVKNLVKRFTKLKSSNPDDITANNSNSEGGKSSKPIRCSVTKSPRLDFLVTKKQESLHHSDWTDGRNFGQSSKSGVGYQTED